TPFQLWLKLRRERPGMVHVHHGGEAGAMRVARAAAADGVPVLVTCHETGSDAIEPHPEVRRAYQRADLIAAPSRGTAERLVRTWGIARDRLRWIPYGTEPADEALEHAPARAWRDRLGVRTLRPLWVCPLKLERRRGHEVLLDALA